MNRGFTIRWLVVVLFSKFLVPHFQDDSAREKSRALQVPRQRAYVRRCLKASGLNPFVLEAVFRRLRAVKQRSRLENADFIFVSRRDFSGVSAAIERRYSDIVVNSARYDLHTFKRAGKDDNVTARCVCLKRVHEFIMTARFE